MITGLFGGILLLASASCGPLYKVAPMPASMPADRAAVQTAAGISVEASAVSEIQSQDQFDANLPLAGVIAIEARIINQTSQPVTPGKLRLELISSAGTRYESLKPSEALKRLMKFYGNTYYFIESYQLSRAAFVAVGIPLDQPIPSGTEAHGFLFFKAPGRSTNLTGLLLSAKDHHTPLKLKLN